MNTVVLKFGGTSVADNIRLNVVAEKIISIKKEAKNVAVVVSAQGKTTNQLIKEAQELSAIPEEREMDMLLSTGEQIAASKLAILLNRKGYRSSIINRMASRNKNKFHTYKCKNRANCNRAYAKRTRKRKYYHSSWFPRN